MTINQILNLDCTREGSCEVIFEYLKKIKPLSKYRDIDDIPFYMIEKVVGKLSKKYNMKVRSIVPDIYSNDKEMLWIAYVMDDRTLKQLEIIYGLSLHEVLAKVAIYMYFMRNKVGER